MKTPNQIRLFLSFCFVLFCINQDIIGQCLGPVNDGEPLVFILNGDDDESFDLGNFMVTVSFDNMEQKVYLTTSDGTMIHTDGAGNVVNLDPDVDISMLGNYMAPPACLFDVGSNQGQFGGNAEGYVAFKNGETYGWIYLTLCGVTSCSDYRVAIEERRFDQGSSITGMCPAIPTLSQWAIIILGICFIILGIITIEQKNVSLGKIQRIS